MEPQGGKPNPPLISPELLERLENRGPSFDFFQAVRLILRARDALKPVGYFIDPALEAVHFGTFPSLSFPPAEIQSLESARGEEPALMRTNFFGLLGTAGILPTFYTAVAIERLIARDETFRDFVDIFQHRVLSLFYRAWEKYRFAIPYERQNEDSVSPILADLIGLGTEGLRSRQEVADEDLLGYAGLLGQVPRSMSALQQILADYFSVPVEVIPFSGTWRKIEPAAISRLSETRSRYEQLGMGTVLGDEVWDEQSVVRVRIGPLRLDQYRQFLPDGDAFRPLRAIQKFFCGEDFDVELQLVLDRRDVPRCGLGVEDQIEPRLGWISWMFSKPLDRDPDETILRLWEL